LLKQLHSQDQELSEISQELFFLECRYDEEWKIWNAETDAQGRLDMFLHKDQRSSLDLDSDLEAPGGQEINALETNLCRQAEVITRCERAILNSERTTAILMMELEIAKLRDQELKQSAELLGLEEKISKEKVEIDVLQGKEAQYKEALADAEHRWRGAWSNICQPEASHQEQAVTAPESKSKNDRIKGLEQELFDLKSNHNKDLQKLQKQFNDFKEESSPRLTVADAILGRQREYARSNRTWQQENIIQAGNRVAHYGSALAHASRLKKIYAADWPWYTEEFGMTPEYVWNVLRKASDQWINIANGMVL
jgi:hypothetical protein